MSVSFTARLFDIKEDLLKSMKQGTACLSFFAAHGDPSLPRHPQIAKDLHDLTDDVEVTLETGDSDRFPMIGVFLWVCDKGEQGDWYSNPGHTYLPFEDLAHTDHRTSVVMPLYSLHGIHLADLHASLLSGITTGRLPAYPIRAVCVHPTIEKYIEQMSDTISTTFSKQNAVTELGMQPWTRSTVYFPHSVIRMTRHQRQQKTSASIELPMSAFCRFPVCLTEEKTALLSRLAYLASLVNGCRIEDANQSQLLEIACDTAKLIPLLLKYRLDKVANTFEDQWLSIASHPKPHRASFDCEDGMEYAMRILLHLQRGHFPDDPLLEALQKVTQGYVFMMAVCVAKNRDPEESFYHAIGLGVDRKWLHETLKLAGKPNPTPPSLPTIVIDTTECIASSASATPPEHTEWEHDEVHCRSSIDPQQYRFVLHTLLHPIDDEFRQDSKGEVSDLLWGDEQGNFGGDLSGLLFSGDKYKPVSIIPAAYGDREMWKECDSHFADLPPDTGLVFSVDKAQDQRDKVPTSEPSTQIFFSRNKELDPPKTSASVADLYVADGLDMRIWSFVQEDEREHEQI